MKTIQRIAIIGNCGSGKSILTHHLHTILHLPMYYLDQYFWKPGWIRQDPNEYKKSHDALCEQEEWTQEPFASANIPYQALALVW